MDQLQHTFNTIGQFNVENELKEIDNELKEMAQMKCKLNSLILKKKNNIQLNEEQLNEKLATLASLTEEQTKLKQKLQNTQKSTLEQFFNEEKMNNEQMKKQIEELEKEFSGFEEICDNESLYNMIMQIESELQLKLTLK